MLPGDEAGTLGAAAELAGATVVLEVEDAVEPAALEVLAAPGVLTGPAVLVAEEAAELAEELQAVNRTATHARDAQDTTCRVLSTFVISMMSNPSINE